MGKLSADCRTAMLGAAGGIFTFSVFLLVERISSYYAYLSSVYREEYQNYSGVDDLWWVPGIFWHVLVSVVASFVVHRYVADRCRSPFLLWQVVGFSTLLGWLLTLSIATVLECVMQGGMYPLERAGDMFFTWFAAKFVAAVFACNVVYSSLIHSAASQYLRPPDKLGAA